MCEFISWIEKNNTLLYLTTKDLKNKKIIADWKYAIKHNKVDSFYEDLKGHGMIRKVYDFDDGEEKECTDFSSKKNFPKEIVEAIMTGQFRGIGYNIDLLSKSGQKEFDKIIQQASNEYNKINQPARDEYNKIYQQARDEYNNIPQQAWYKFNRINQQARDEYNKINQQAWDEFNKILNNNFWDIFQEKKYRARAWK